MALTVYGLDYFQPRRAPGPSGSMGLRNSFALVSCLPHSPEPSSNHPPDHPHRQNIPTISCCNTTQTGPRRLRTKFPHLTTSRFQRSSDFAPCHLAPCLPCRHHGTPTQHRLVPRPVHLISRRSSGARCSICLHYHSLLPPVKAGRSTKRISPTTRSRKRKSPRSQMSPSRLASPPLRTRTNIVKGYPSSQDIWGRTLRSSDQEARATNKGEATKCR